MQPVVPTFSFGYLPDSPDPRDYKLQWSPGKDLPSKIDLREGFQKIKNQGSLGACTAFATTSMVEYVRNKEGLLTWDASPLFTYYSTRKIENTINSDSGAMVRNALKSTANDGVTKESYWPYNTSNFTICPPQSAWDDAQTHQALVYYSINQTKDDLLGCLADGYPFTFGTKLYQSFIDKQTGFIVDDTVCLPLPNDSLVGGHCMTAVGYTSAVDSIKVIVRNSWGEYVGLSGYHQFPLEYLLRNDLSFDFWTIRSEERAPEDPQPTPPPTPEPLPPTPAPTPEPPQPQNDVSIWKQPWTYVLIGFGILTLLFFLL